MRFLSWQVSTSRTTRAWLTECIGLMSETHLIRIRDRKKPRFHQQNLRFLDYSNRFAGESGRSWFGFAQFSVEQRSFVAFLKGRMRSRLFLEALEVEGA